MTNAPKVRRMVLFKHGVAYLERAGPAQGPFDLSFEVDEMSDVLKSLTVWVSRGAARIGAIAFDKPEDPEQALQSRNLALEKGAALFGLLWAMRGRRVRVVTRGELCEGEVIGIDQRRGMHGEEQRSVALRTSGGSVSVLDLGALSRVELLDASSQADLGYLVERSRAATAGVSRRVTVDVQGEAEEVRVSYVIPAPTWRVAYRIAKQGDTAQLMAWAVVHNPADESLEDIELVLTTGQPVSFFIDLYNPREIDRAVVAEQSRRAAAPHRLAMGRPVAVAGAARAAPMAAAQMAETYELDMAEAFEAASEASSYADRGELFEYRISTPVSLSRGGSAMVPLLSARIEGHRERIWRVGAAPAPDLVFSFKNDSGAVLEEGPAVLYEEAVYAGESMLPYAPRNTEVKLAFAKDLAMRCEDRVEVRHVTTDIQFRHEFFAVETRLEYQHALTAESDHAEPVDVIFELPKITGRTLSTEHDKPFEDTLSHHRLRTTVPPRSRTTLCVLEFERQETHLRYADLTTAHVKSWTNAGVLPEPTAQQLSELLAMWQEQRRLEEQSKRTSKSIKDAYAKQQKITEQLSVLKEAGAEGTLRLRYVRELEHEHDKVNEAEAEVARLEADLEAVRSRAREKLAEVAGREGS